MSHRPFHLFAVCGCLLLATSAARGQPQPQNTFKQLDRDGDGRLSREEFPLRVQRLFDQVDENGDGFISAEEDAVFRRITAAGQAPRLPEGIQGELDIAYGSDSPRQKLDLLLPKEPASSAPLPVIVYIHGGAWRGGDKHEGFAFLIRSVAGGHYAGVTIGYRLTGEATWPAQIHDCKAAIRWIRAHAEQYHLDPQRIGVMGVSAGGHLAALLGTSSNIARLDGKVGEHAELSSRVACVVDLYGPTELLALSQFPSDIEHDAPESPESRLVGGPLQQRKEVARGASPITYVSVDDPPFLIVHGTEDPLVPYDQSERFLAALEQEGVDAMLLPVRGGGHGDFRSAELDRRIRLFFDKYLLEKNDIAIPTASLQPGQKTGAPAGP